MADKHTVTVEIAGARYRMTTDSSEEHLLRLAAAVNERIAALGPKAARAASPAQLLAVVALGLAEDLEVSEQRRERLEGTARKAIASAIERIDRRLAADAGAEGDAGTPL